MTAFPNMSQLESAYSGRTVVVTGGASFIGSHLVDALSALGALVFVVDDFSSGKRENLGEFPAARISEIDLADRNHTLSSFPEGEIVFHLAAVHGGRGFIETYPHELLVNFAIDNNVYSAARAGNARRIVHASSACVYPVTLQASTSDRYLLAEADAGFDLPGQAFADGAYGWTKLLGEYQLMQFAEHCPLTGAAARLFTAYGERENESHAAVALIAKALLKLDPYPVWGTGEQTRNFTYVSDTVTGLLLLGSLREPDFLAVNVGSSRHHSIIEFMDVIFQEVGWRPDAFDFQASRPVGVSSRASDNTLIRALFEWEPSVPLEQGVRDTIRWYEKLVDRADSPDSLERRLLSR